MSKVSASRFNNTVRNITTSFVVQIITILLNIIGRRVFVQVLSAEYLGISTAFSSVLSVLSLAELGVGSAIVYSMYKPIAKKDYESIKSLMRLYKLVYRAVGTVVFVIGVSLVPFLSTFVKEMPDIPHVRLIYVLLVVQSASTYFFSYKASFLSATQQGYIVQKYNVISSTLQLILQIISLLAFGNYYMYLIIGIAGTLSKNILASVHVDRHYPYLKGKAQKLPQATTRSIKKNIAALFLYKISATLSVAIDTILVSKFLGVIECAIYANYHFVLQYSDLLFNIVFGSITPSIGNLMTTDDIEKKRKFFSALQMVYYWIATYLAVGLIVLFNPLIELWLGKEYLFPQSIVVALAVSATLTNFQRPCSLMRDANGLFWYGKLRPLAMAIINLSLSVFLVRRIGTIGVVIGTAVSKLLTFVWYDPYIVFKHTLKEGLGKYFIKYLFHWCFLGALTFVCNNIYIALNISGFKGFLIGVIVVTIVVNTAFFLLNFRKEEFKYVISLIKGLTQRLKKEH